MKVLIADRLSAEGLQVFEQAAGLEVCYRPGLTSEELLVEIRDADALVVRSGSEVTAAVLEAAPQLRVIGKAGIDTDNIDMAVATRRGVVVLNTPFGSATTSAEHTLAMLMALARKIPQGDRHMRRGFWEQEPFLGVEITGKTLGVMGAGKIGRLVVERALALKMRVLVYDPYLSEETVLQMGAEQADFEQLLAESDFLTMHLPLTDETSNILGEEALRRVKPGVRIINCAQGGLVDEEALNEALQEKRVAGAALDVFAKEPPERNHPLLAREDVIFTPHLRTSTLDAQTNVARQVASQIVAFLLRGEVENAVNVPSISAELLTVMRPYLVLAEKLGSFQAQYNAKGLEKVTIRYAGSVTGYPMQPLTLAVLKGLLTPMLGEQVNFVNAPHLARERGITVVEAKYSTSEGFSNLIELEVVTADGTHSVSGALFGDTDNRIVRIDGFSVEASPEGCILVLRNHDRPGVIGFIGKVLGDGGVNIAMMNLSRRKIAGQAVSLITVDGEVPESVLETLRADACIVSASQVKL